jgi:DNA ligase (NAD+)
VAGAIRAFFLNEANREVLAAFKAIGLWPRQQENSPGVPENSMLDGKKVLFTGSLSRSRDEFQAMAEQAGAKVLSAVSKNLDYLIVGEHPGSKLAKAEALGISILDEAGFLALLK